MPAVRTTPALPLKAPMKTERTHEENQERAYIAASRRSDRSLEARVESARRASEIHKRRTGRSLRVTEQDVINEEMYEEEDDDLPMQYRRLTAHLGISDAGFDSRLQAYLANHIAMRNAIAQATASGSWTGSNQFSSFMNTDSKQMQQQHATQQALVPAQPTSTPTPNSLTNRPPNSYRQTPYPPPADNRPSTHHRSASIAHVQNTPTPTLERTSSQFTDSRYQSTPGQQGPIDSPVEMRKDFALPQRESIEPLSTTLPLESQQLLAGGPFFQNADFNGLMPMNYNQPSDVFNFDQGDLLKSGMGLNQTLLGGQDRDSGNDMFFGNNDEFKPSGMVYGNFCYSPFDFDLLKPSGASLLGGSGVNTPAAKEDWSSFLDGDAFEGSQMV